MTTEPAAPDSAQRSARRNRWHRSSGGDIDRGTVAVMILTDYPTSITAGGDHTAFEELVAMHRYGRFVGDQWQSDESRIVIIGQWTPPGWSGPAPPIPSPYTDAFASIDVCLDASGPRITVMWVPRLAADLLEEAFDDRDDAVVRTVDLDYVGAELLPTLDTAHVLDAFLVTFLTRSDNWDRVDEVAIFVDKVAAEGQARGLELAESLAFADEWGVELLAPWD